MKNRVLVLTGLCVGFMSTVSAEDQNVSASRTAQAKKNDLTVSDVIANRDVKLDATIRFVETFTVMGEGEPGQIERKEIESKRDLASQEIQEESKKIEKAKNEYVSKATTMTDKARENEEKKLMKMERDLKNLVAEKEEELKLEMQLATEKLAYDMELAVVELAQQDGIDIVFDKMTGRAIYVSDAFDVTDKVIKRVNEKHHIKLAQNKKTEGSLKVADNKAAAGKSAKVGA